MGTAAYGATSPLARVTAKDGNTTHSRHLVSFVPEPYEERRDPLSRIVCQMRERERIGNLILVVQKQ
jgi:hypothetical protein